MYRYLVLVILLLLFENTMASCPAYDRRDYPHWIDLDQDCQNTRHEVLVEESTVPVQFKTKKKMLSCRRQVAGFVYRQEVQRSWEIGHRPPGSS